MAISAHNIAAVIVTHQRVELLKESLRIVATQSTPVRWIIVVDNGNEQAVRELVAAECGERGVYLPSETNLGGAGGFAFGFLHALSLGASAVWCADDDGRPADENVLRTLLDCAQRHDLAAVSPVVCNIDDPDTLAFPLRRGLEWRRKRSELIDPNNPDDDLLPGIASLFNGALFSQQVVLRVGVPDLRLFIRGDEVEYHRRLVRSGLAFGTCLTTAYLHPNGADEFHPILGGRMHAQYPASEAKRFFTYRNRGYLMNQPGMRRLLPQEYGRFGWFFLIQRHDWRGFKHWLHLHQLGRKEHFPRPEDLS
ncbi:MAG: glycosyltransferase family 2 protein [Corynebacterium sp.]|nr:glycosyltransferase family 2 protein [Corynebacterium sp.]